MILFKNELKTNYKSLLIWTLCVGGLSLGCILLYSSLESSLNDMAAAYSNMGDFSTAFGMDKMSISTLTGFYATEIAIIFSLGASMFASIISTSVLSKEEALHTSEFLNTFPLGRTKIVIHKYLSVLAEILLFNIACVLMFLIGFAIMGESVPTKEFIIYHLTQVMMQIEIATICFMISAFSRKSLMGAGIGIAVLLYLVDMMCRIVPAIKGLKYITPFYYSNAADIFSGEKFNFVIFIIGIAITILAFVISLIFYNKKDLAS